MKLQTRINSHSNIKHIIFKFVFTLNFILLFSFFAAAQKIETGNFFVTNYSRSFLNTLSVIGAYYRTRMELYILLILMMGYWCMMDKKSEEFIMKKVYQKWV